MALDALTRDESCGCHLREEHQTEENEAKRDDENFCHVAAWEYTGRRQQPEVSQRAPGLRKRRIIAKELQVTMGSHTINITLKVWRQKNGRDKGRLETIPVPNVDTHMSFLEMLDVVNEKLILEGKEPIAFDNDCREGICGMCGCVVNGIAHGPEKAMTLCQLHMRKFADGDTIAVEPWRARAFKIVKDLMVDRSPLDKHHPGRGLHLRQHRFGAGRQCHPDSDGSGRKGHGRRGLHRLRGLRGGLPQRLGHAVRERQGLPTGPPAPGKPEAAKRAMTMVKTMDALAFGNCSNHRVCEAVCPKEVSIVNIARLNREFIKAGLASDAR
jgi:succinate dehydrogenase / fumarate reductase iron-sulfur subunit